METEWRGSHLLLQEMLSIFISKNKQKRVYRTSDDPQKIILPMIVFPLENSRSVTVKIQSVIKNIHVNKHIKLNQIQEISFVFLDVPDK
jgi:hypothetical protein